MLRLRSLPRRDIEAALFWRLRLKPRGLRAASSTEAALPECGCGMEMGAVAVPAEVGAGPAPATPPLWAVWLRALVLELVRWCCRPVLALVGMGKPGPDMRCVSVKEEGPCCDWSAVVELLVEEALETTEELWAARRRVRSRVRRFT